MGYRHTTPKLSNLLKSAVLHGGFSEYPQFKAEYLKTTFKGSIPFHSFRISGDVNCKVVLFKDTGGDYYFSGESIGEYGPAIAGLVTVIRKQCIKALKQISKQPRTALTKGEKYQRYINGLLAKFKSQPFPLGVWLEPYCVSDRTRLVLAQRLLNESRASISLNN